MKAQISAEILIILAVVVAVAVLVSKGIYSSGKKLNTNYLSKVKQAARSFK